MSGGVKRILAWLMRSLECAIDRLPKAAGIAGNEYGRTVAASLQALLPERSAAEREAILRGVVRHLLLNRVIDVLHASCPALASAFARLVPIVQSPSAANTIRNNGTPLVIGSAHFGPLFFQLVVLRRLFTNRRLIVVLRADAHYLPDTVPLIRLIGYEFVFDDPDMLFKLRHALREDPRTVVMFTFDHTRYGRHVVRFLGGALMTSNGIGLLADIGNTPVVSSFWEWHHGFPRVVLGGPYYVDRSLPPRERRQRLRDNLHSIVESRIVAIPEQWTGWHNVAPSIVPFTPHRVVS